MKSDPFASRRFGKTEYPHPGENNRSNGRFGDELEKETPKEAAKAYLESAGYIAG